MVLYLSVVFIGMVVITLCNYFFGNSGQDLLYISLLVLIATFLQIVIDLIFAGIIRWFFPKKWVSVDKIKVYCATKKEQIFYEKLGIKKWKDYVFELGALSGFRKNKLGDVNDLSYIERFIYEANYGILIHFACIIFGVAIIFICPKPFWWTVGLPITIINIVLNVLPTMILKYNLPKLHTLYKYNKRKLERETSKTN